MAFLREMVERARYWFGTARCMGCVGRVRIVNGSRACVYCPDCIQSNDRFYTDFV
jgi:hypothetical protein